MWPPNSQVKSIVSKMNHEEVNESGSKSINKSIVNMIDSTISSRYIIHKLCYARYKFSYGSRGFCSGRDGSIPTRMSKSKDRPYKIAGHQEGSNYRALPPAVINRNDPEDLCYTFAEGPFSSCSMLESTVFEFLWLLRSLDRHNFFSTLR